MRSQFFLIVGCRSFCKRLFVRESPQLISVRHSIFLALTSILFFSKIAIARDATILSLRSNQGTHRELSQKELSRISAMKVLIQIPAQGIATLSVTRATEAPRNQLLFKGFFFAPARGIRRDSRGEKRWAALSVLNNGDLAFNFSAPGSHGAIRYYALSGSTLKLSKKLRIVRAPHYALSGKGCRTEAGSSSALHQDEHSIESLPLIARASLSKRYSLRTVADHLWNQRYGSNSNSRIMTISNAASAIYNTDLGMEISVASQKVDTNPSSYPESITASETILNLFRSSGEKGSANVGFLFTGRNFNEGVIGIAYIGVACLAPSFSYGAIQRFQDALDPVVLAHELGHTLSAKHVSDGIMTESLNPSSPPRSFSSASISQISTFVGQYGSCLVTTASVPTPIPTPTSVSTPNPSQTPGSSPTPVSGTPVATPTSAATPNPNRTPGSTGNSGIRIGFQLDGARINLSIAQNSADQACSFVLKAGLSSRSLFSRGITLRTYYGAGALSETLFARIPRRTRNSVKIYIRGYSLCEGSSPTPTNLKWFDASELTVGRIGSGEQIVEDLKRRLR
jgi:hypothetical protein